MMTLACDQWDPRWVHGNVMDEESPYFEISILPNMEISLTTVTTTESGKGLFAIKRV